MILGSIGAVPLLAAPHGNTNTNANANANGNFNANTADAGALSSSGSSVNISGGTTLYPAIPQPPDHTKELAPLPFHWNMSPREQNERYYAMHDYIKNQQWMLDAQANANRGGDRVAELMSMGLNKPTAQARALYEEGIGPKPIIYQGGVVGEVYTVGGG